MVIKTLHHGSDHVVECPRFGFGDKHTDYGQGFYCTENADLAKEWGARRANSSFVNTYRLDTKGLKNLNLSSGRYTTLHWLAVLLRNREISLEYEVAVSAKEYIIDRFDVDTSGYDTISGYRADDSYFTYVMEFLNNMIPVQTLSRAMRLGKIGEQFVLKSEKAFEKIEFVGAEPVEFEKYSRRRADRDSKAVATYQEIRNEPMKEDDLFIMDIIRHGVDENDPRIR